MGKFQDKVQRFFYGRNGVDKLNRFIFLLYFISFIVYLFVKHYTVLIVSSILLIIYFYRMLSKKLYKRQKENEIYLKITSSIKRPFLRFFHRIRDRKTHVYKKCPNCKKILKLRKVKGSHTVKCPVCSNHFNIKI
ncbi:MAG: hypothetical protein E7183_05605 [Erysipelotrichaceae bacterium]|nr:hypothetical protein [Erysipelotrichaceae bacterium]